MRGALWIAVGIAVSTLGFLSQSILTAPRVYYAMARDGLFFAERGTALARASAAPVVAIVLQGLAATAIALSGRYEQILNYEVSVDFILFALMAASLFVFRRREGGVLPAGVYGVPGHPYTTALFVAACVAIVAGTVCERPGKLGEGLGDPAHRHSRILVLEPAAQALGAHSNHDTQTLGVHALGQDGQQSALQSGHQRGGAVPAARTAVRLRKPGDQRRQQLRLSAAEAGHRREVRRGPGLRGDGRGHLDGQLPGDGHAARCGRRGADRASGLRAAGGCRALHGRSGESGSRAAKRTATRWIPAEVRRAMTPKTRLIVLTNLHNPSSVLTPEACCARWRTLARSVGARVLVDEVYLDAVYEDTPPTAFHLGPEVRGHQQPDQGVRTERAALRVGAGGAGRGARHVPVEKCDWVRSRVYPGELLSVAAFEHLDAIRERARRVVEADRAALAEFLDANGGVSAVRTAWGTTSFFRLKNGGAEAFLERLRAEFETSAVPGRFFGMPEHFRVGMGVDAAMFREGLRRVGQALESGRGAHRRDTETQKKIISKAIEAPC